MPEHWIPVIELAFSLGFDRGGASALRTESSKKRLKRAVNNLDRDGRGCFTPKLRIAERIKVIIRSNATPSTGAFITRDPDTNIYCLISQNIIFGRTPAWRTPSMQYIGFGSG